MYNKHNNFSKNRNNSQGFNRNQNSRRNIQVKKIDPSLFINDNATEETKEEFIPKTSFENYPIDDRLKRNILEHGYVKPTPIQDQAIPLILAGRDIIGIANTGTGKTASFLIPLVNKVDRSRGERVLVIAPTRELAMQILDELKEFSKGMDLESLLCIGGASSTRQEMKLKHNPNFVIGTPGRIKDLIERNKLNLFLFQNIVLDEVDRMVDIGFIHDIKFIISRLPKKRHSLFFSATVDGKTKEILNNFVTDPVTVSVKHQETASSIEQSIIKINDKYSKIDTLHNMLSEEEYSKVLIFGRTKWGIEKLSKNLISRGFKAASIHGNKSQGQRQRALEGFKNGQLQVLLATDVASRGLDIEDVSHVINFDQPATYDDYVHRIGRTGRAGKRGKAITFVD